MTDIEQTICRARLDDGDLDRLRDVLDAGHNLTRSDGYALITEILVWRARCEEARKTRDALIRSLTPKAAS